MNNEERAMVGTAYKKQGREDAMELGFKLVSGEIKVARVAAWKSFLNENPNAIVTCFRGGLRSKISQEWLAEAGIVRPRIEGGFKAFRNFLIEETLNFTKNHEFLVVSGATGAGKTEFLRKIVSEKQVYSKSPVLDLEKIANHRGSAFGAFDTPQPSQINFENELASALINIDNEESFKGHPVLVEDESRLVGIRAVPDSVFNLMRSSPVILIEESIETRTENTYQEYVLNSGLLSRDQKPNFQRADLIFNNFKSATLRISKKLGGLRAQEIHKNIEESEKEFKNSCRLEGNKIWIHKLLAWYYDPMYLGSLSSRSPKIILRGTKTELLNNIQSTATRG
jgi:tRNA 2-selenouridine synthase